MTDKDKQLDLELGKVEYITDPNFVPERLVDQVGIDNLTEDHFHTLIQEVLENGQHYIDYGDLDGDHFVVVDSWECYYHIIGVLNGFDNLGNKPYLSNGQSYHDKIMELQLELNRTDHNHLGSISRIKSQIQDCQSWIEFNKYIDFNEFETVDIDDFGIEWGFSDEYSRCACGNCDKIVRTSPDSYCWTAPLFVDCEGYISDDCVSDGNFDDYILEEYCNVQKSIPDARDPGDLGLVKINKDSYQNGMHYGMDDSPEPIIEALNAADIDVWFKVYPSQFYCDFDVYVKAEDQDRAVEILNGTDTYQGYSTAGNLEKALKSVSLQPTNNEGVTVNTVDVSTGTVSTKVVSKQDFIDGKALK